MAGAGSHALHRNGSGEESDTDYESENIKPRGLTGLQNLGNTCYLNSAVQSLSNCPPLTRYFLDCPALIRPEKSPMLSRSYLKLITELWHKKRPSYVVPSGVVSGIKAVHPMFKGYTQQDAQEFLRCFMDQLHEELKSPVSFSDDESDEENENDERLAGEDGNNSAKLQNDSIGGVQCRVIGDQKNSGPEVLTRRPSYDSLSSHSEMEYETCDSGLSSERSSNNGRDNGSSGDESNSDSNDQGKLQRPSERTRKSSAMSAGSVNEDYQPALDSVANIKEMKETANLLEKETEMRRPRPNKVVMEGGDSKEQGAVLYANAVAGKDTPECQHSPLPTEIQHPKAKMKQTPTKPRKKKNMRFESIISQTFDGKILSSVRCLNCETVSTTKETFQDLSLPIPSKDHLHMLHSGYPTASGGVTPPKGGACGEVHQGWLASMFFWMKSWFVGPTITLQDCLSAFFSADELKGDNMYSCEKCKKLRNGLKYSKVLELPEILSIHLKRFRHEFYSSKISTYISFPLEGLDMSPYIHKGCNNEVTSYDLVAIICHHGTAGGGHYTAYCLNYLNGQWYEFDDQYVTEVDVSQVQNCEAYVLFYKKNNKKIEAIRQRVSELETDENSIMKFFISKQWFSRFHTFSEPGPVTNVDFLCKHGGVPPAKVNIIDDLVGEIHQSTWELLYSSFGGGPVCNHLYACKTCRSELDKLRQRQHTEKEAFIQLNEEFQEEENAASVYAISMAWFKEWESFVREKTDSPPDAIDNSRISIMRNGQPVLRHNSDYGHLSRDMWLFLYRIYGGGSEVVIRQSTGATVKKGGAPAAAATSNNYAQQQQPSPPNPTLASLAAGASPTSPAVVPESPRRQTSSSSPSVRPASPSPVVSTTTVTTVGASSCQSSSSPPPSAPVKSSSSSSSLPPPPTDKTCSSSAALENLDVGLSQSTEPDVSDSLKSTEDKSTSVKAINANTLAPINDVELEINHHDDDIVELEKDATDPGVEEGKAKEGEGKAKEGGSDSSIKQQASPPRASSLTPERSNAKQDYSASPAKPQASCSRLSSVQEAEGKENEQEIITEETEDGLVVSNDEASETRRLNAAVSETKDLPTTDSEKQSLPSIETKNLQETASMDTVEEKKVAGKQQSPSSQEVGGVEETIVDQQSPGDSSSKNVVTIDSNLSATLDEGDKTPHTNESGEGVESGLNNSISNTNLSPKSTESSTLAPKEKKQGRGKRNKGRKQMDVTRI